MLTYARPLLTTHRTEHEVLKSRFITSVSRATSVEEARLFISTIRQEMSDASHHVYAYRIGHGNSVIDGMSDDGEPSGTAGPPSMAVLRGSKLGDIVLVTTRYFGGTLLGTGGLVKAYTESAQLALESLVTVYRRKVAILGIGIPYSCYEPAKRLLNSANATITDEVLSGSVEWIVQISIEDEERITKTLLDLTAGRAEQVLLGVEEI
jgi:uncharacterized YigZ family protein